MTPAQHVELQAISDELSRDMPRNPKVERLRVLVAKIAAPPTLANLPERMSRMASRRSKPNPKRGKR